jgi:hypothetical protein
VGRRRRRRREGDCINKVEMEKKQIKEYKLRKMEEKAREIRSLNFSLLCDVKALTYDDRRFHSCGGQRGRGVTLFSETSLRMYQATRSHIKQHVNLHSSHQKNLKFHIVILQGDDFK